MSEWPVHARADGGIVMVGFGSIGRGTLPLILRHIACDRSKITIVAPDEDNRSIAEELGCTFQPIALTSENFRDVLTPLLTVGPGQGLLVNVSVDVSSVDMMAFCQEIEALYIDTVVEPWPGFYTDDDLPMAERTNAALRATLLNLRKEKPMPTTAVSCCGANPGMVSWFVKQALINLCGDLGMDATVPSDREGWASLMQKAGVKGIHIAEKDTQRGKKPKDRNVFVNTWSVEGFISEAMQPAELGFGSHEKQLPADGRRFDDPTIPSIYLTRPGGMTRVRSWTPTAGPQHGYLVTHDEAISISDYFTIWDKGRLEYRPTCHYAYRPADDAVLSVDELSGQAWRPQDRFHILEEDEILDGIDELGVLLYGHAKNAYWYGSQLSIEETRELAPYQNATGLQVTSAILAGIVWAIENPTEGICEPDEMDFQRCLEVQLPYLGPVTGHYTDWTPIDGRGTLFPEDIDHDDPWQFSNVIVR